MVEAIDTARLLANVTSDFPIMLEMSNAPFVYPVRIAKTLLREVRTRCRYEQDARDGAAETRPAPAR